MSDTADATDGGESTKSERERIRERKLRELQELEREGEIGGEPAEKLGEESTATPDEIDRCRRTGGVPPCRRRARRGGSRLLRRLVRPLSDDGADDRGDRKRHRRRRGEGRCRRQPGDRPAARRTHPRPSSCTPTVRRSTGLRARRTERRWSRRSNARPDPGRNVDENRSHRPTCPLRPRRGRRPVAQPKTRATRLIVIEKIAILGGTGDIGQGLALRLAADTHHEVTIGSRDAERAETKAEEYTTELDSRGLDATVAGAENETAAAAAAESSYSRSHRTTSATPSRRSPIRSTRVTCSSRPRPG